MSITHSAIVRRTAVGAVRGASPSSTIAALALDSPTEGQKAPGCGLEINGWAIGRGAPLRGVRAVVDSAAGEPVPLSVRRPDVAADYPDDAHADRSGYSLWIPLPEIPGPWQITVEALTAAGERATLAEIDANVLAEQRSPGIDTRPVLAPDVVIIGAQRGGTTSLHAYLSAHPRFTAPSTKELHFLTDRHHRGHDWYLGQFPATVPNGTLTGEATPYALFHPHAPRRLKAVAPDARLIVLLRNPVDRAYSHYLLERARGDESLAFEAALAAEPERIAGEADRLAADSGYVSALHNHASYLARGDYAPQLSRWFASFPRERFLIVRSEDFYQRTADVYADILSFLDLPSASGMSFIPHNRTDGPSLDRALRSRLEDHFAEPNARLAELLGWDLTWS